MLAQVAELDPATCSPVSGGQVMSAVVISADNLDVHAQVSNPPLGPASRRFDAGSGFLLDPPDGDAWRWRLLPSAVGSESAAAGGTKD